MVSNRLIAPRNVRQLSNILKAYNDYGGERIQIVGSGTKAPTKDVGSNHVHRLTTLNLSKVLSYEPENLIITSEAGASLNSLLARLERENQFIPMDPPFQSRATIGGILATNSFGPSCFKYGYPRNSVVGCKIGLPSGVIIKSGASVPKNTLGYNIDRLMIGSHGSLGVITEVAMRTLPCPEISEDLNFSGRIQLDELAIILKKLAVIDMSICSVKWTRNASGFIGLMVGIEGDKQEAEVGRTKTKNLVLTHGLCEDGGTVESIDDLFTNSDRIIRIASGYMESLSIAKRIAEISRISSAGIIMDYSGVLRLFLRGDSVSRYLTQRILRSIGDEFNVDFELEKNSGWNVVIYNNGTTSSITRRITSLFDPHHVLKGPRYLLR